MTVDEKFGYIYYYALFLQEEDMGSPDVNESQKLQSLMDKRFYSDVSNGQLDIKTFLSLMCEKGLINGLSWSLLMMTVMFDFQNDGMESLCLPVTMLDEERLNDLQSRKLFWADKFITAVEQNKLHQLTGPVKRNVQKIYKSRGKHGNDILAVFGYLLHHLQVH